MTTEQHINFMADYNGQDNFGKAAWLSLRKSKREATQPTNQRTVASHLLLP